MTPYHCEARCGAVFEHPDVDECPSGHDGMCAHLTGAGWRPVYVRIFPDKCDMKWNEKTLLLARGGWFCPACVERTRRR